MAPDNKAVFAEDAYHDKFIDSFSWSNLTQLNHLNQNPCLLVGLSITDPNLRRLLDVSMRKNPDRDLNHYVFKKSYDPCAIVAWTEKNGVQGISAEEIEHFVTSAELLEEQDATILDSM